MEQTLTDKMNTAYQRRKWELYREVVHAFPRFPKVGNNRKKRLVELMMEHEGVTKEEANEWIERQKEVDREKW